MSSPVAINRPSSPAESSSVSSSIFSNTSTSSRSSALYTRDELLALATSPLSQAPVPPAVAAFPMIMRKTRRGVLEAYQTLEYARRSSGHVAAPAPLPAPIPVVQRNAENPQRSSSPPRAQTDSSAQPPMWKVDVYVPPARRVEQEQRVRLGRDARLSRTWRRPAPARVQTQSRW